MDRSLDLGKPQQQCPFVADEWEKEEITCKQVSSGNGANLLNLKDPSGNDKLIYEMHRKSSSIVPSPPYSSSLTSHCGRVPRPRRFRYIRNLRLGDHRPGASARGHGLDQGQQQKGHPRRDSGRRQRAVHQCVDGHALAHGRQLGRVDGLAVVGWRSVVG